MKTNETATEKIRLAPSTRLRLKRRAEKVAKQRKVILVSYDTAINLLLDATEGTVL